MTTLIIRVPKLPERPAGDADPDKEWRPYNTTIDNIRKDVESQLWPQLNALGKPPVVVNCGDLGLCQLEFGGTGCWTARWLDVWPVKIVT